MSVVLGSGLLVTDLRSVLGAVAEMSNNRRLRGCRSCGSNCAPS
jgi:hypothetical protein